ncbi:M15 family metallopeptidase [Paenibacillus sediminis]|uniref:Peptidoglycan L-alanyl-D-glutamate endopeptidase CwlK n=1 Tax=Paenibacillus sediminis TaxID=664909 RepID=A0ABS4H6P6_9BACL|nr:M15 family metallopeptidase [Paenibacillus sediminis]MBP1938209.1 peptidoglycan L-alanyl-D-glutamate endopeptidase CwlK [Paenibacillus sediminis]
MITLDQVRAKSASKLAGLHPVVLSATQRLIERTYARGIPIVITQGLRTIAEQDALYAQGRTKPGAIVTNARGGESFHNFGVAVDFALLLPDGRTLSWDTLRDGNLDLLPDWSEVVDEAKALGFAWGGDWRSFKDLPHFEMTFGLTTAQYRSGAIPDKTKVDAVLAILNPVEDDEDVKLDNANVIVNGTKVKDGFLMNGSVYVPLRDVADRFGATIAWDNATKTATVKTK